MSMSLHEAEIWELRQMAESPYYVTRRAFLNLIADKLERFEDTKREVDVLKHCIDRICEITGDLEYTNENVVLGVERIKRERDAAVAMLEAKARSLGKCRHGIAFSEYCGKCEASIRAEPADTKLRRG